jgi:tetratricopeptide (TPR) repeat protein
MIDLEGVNADHMTWEAIEAYEEAMRLSPADPALLRARQIQLMLEVDDDDRLWSAFGDLVRVDTMGEQVRATIDELIALDDVGPAIAVLEAAVSEQPDRADLKANLAALYLADEDYSSAHDMLTAAEAQTDDSHWRADIQRMMLAVEEPDFEARLGEIIDRLEADNGLNEDQVDLLEWAVERAPTYAEAYVLLARAYILWEDESAAIETLLEADKRVPNDPEVILLLGSLLWEGDQRELAFSYLRRGVSAAPLHVPLLAKFGLYLFEDEQYDAARDYLARAGAIAARHPALVEVRAEIAQRLNDDELRDRLFYDYDQD